MTSTNTTIKNLLLSLNDKPTVIYSAYLRITKDYATAAALAQVLYWHKTMGRKFYKTDADFSAELLLSFKQFERVKNNLKSLDFLIITREQIPAKTFYHIDYDKLAIALIGEAKLPPVKISDTTPEEFCYPLSTESSSPQNEETRFPQKVESNTENTQRLLQKNNNTAPPQVQPKMDLNLSPVVVVELEKVFSNAELPAAKTQLAQISMFHQLAVLAEIVLNLKKPINDNPIRNKIAYLRGIIKNIKNGTFTATPIPAQLMSVDERIKQEKIKREKDAQRGKIDNVGYFVQQVKQFGDLIKVPEQYQQAVFERLAY